MERELRAGLRWISKTFGTVALKHRYFRITLADVSLSWTRPRLTPAYATGEIQEVTHTEWQTCKACDLKHDTWASNPLTKVVLRFRIFVIASGGLRKNTCVIYHCRCDPSMTAAERYEKYAASCWGLPVWLTILSFLFFFSFWLSCSMSLWGSLLYMARVAVVLNMVYNHIHPQHCLHRVNRL